MLLVDANGAQFFYLCEYLNSLFSKGFLTDDLAVQEESERQRKYLGVCRLPGEKMLVKKKIIFFETHLKIIFFFINLNII